MWCLVISLGLVPTLLAETAAQLLEEAFYLESTALDPQGAIEKYRAVLEAPDLDSSIAARAHLRLGVCFHLLGRSQKAREELEVVATDFPSETAAVKVARRILGQPVMENAARFLPPDALFFAEFVDPEKHTHKLLELLEDTPFQNPVDGYRSYLEQRATVEDSSPDNRGSSQQPPPAVRRVSAILNEGILRELGNIQGAALCFPSADRGTADFIFILFPGKSHIVRGAMQFFLAERNARVVTSIGGFPIFETPLDDDGDVYIAFSDDVVLISNRRTTVRESIERSRRQSPSLADNEDYQAALSARSGSFIFSYINSQSLLRVLERERDDESRRVFQTMTRALGLDHLRASSVTLSASATDSLELSLRLDWGEVPPAAWEVFRGPRLGRDVLSAVPPEALGFFGIGLDRTAERWSAVYALAERVVGQLPDPERLPARRQLESLNAAVTEESVEALVAVLSQVVVGIVPTGGRRLWPSFFLVLKVDDPESGPRLFEAALGDLAYRLLQNRASRQFRTETMSDGEREFAVRVLEPLPSVTIRSVDLGDRVVVATSPEALEVVLSRPDPAARTALETVPEEAFKVLFLRPAAISRALAATRRVSQNSARRPELETVFVEETPSALLYTREERGRLLITLSVPEFRSTTRAILKRLAAR